jgi:hypothetical protein
MKNTYVGTLVIAYLGKYVNFVGYRHLRDACIFFSDNT